MANEPFVFSDDVKVSGDTRWLRRDEFSAMLASYIAAYNYISASALAAWFQAVEVYQTGATQSILNTTWSTIAWVGEHFDTGGMHAANSADFVIVKAGTYFVYTGIKWAGNGAGSRLIAIRKNYATEISIEEAGYANNQLQILQRSWNLAVGDTLTVDIYQSSGGALNMICGDYESYFGAFRTGP